MMMTKVKAKERKREKITVMLITMIIIIVSKKILFFIDKCFVQRKNSPPTSKTAAPRTMGAPISSEQAVSLKMAMRPTAFTSLAVKSTLSPVVLITLISTKCRQKQQSPQLCYHKLQTQLYIQYYRNIHTNNVHKTALLPSTL